MSFAGAWTYSGNPGANTKDAVRYYIGDTNSKRKLASDEEIAFVLAANNNDPPTAAKTALLALISKFATMGHSRIGSRSLGEMEFDAADIVKDLQTALAGIDDLLGIARGIWYAGGISKSDKEMVESNSDRVPPRFKRGMQRIQSNESQTESLSIAADPIE